MPATRIVPNEFARRTMEEALAQMRQRLAAIEPLIAEADGLKRAIKFQEDALRRIPARAGEPRALPAGPTVVRSSVPAEVEPVAQRAAEHPSMREQLLILLRRPDARRGVAGAVLARAVRGAQANSVMTALSEMANDPACEVERVGRGFYRLRAHNPDAEALAG